MSSFKNNNRSAEQRFKDDTISLALEYGMTWSRIEHILKDNTFAFLRKVITIVEYGPGDEKMKAALNAESMEQVASILGPWVYRVTPRFRTLVSAIRCYRSHLSDYESTVRLSTIDGCLDKEETRSHRRRYHRARHH